MVVLIGAASGLPWRTFRPLHHTGAHLSQSGNKIGVAGLRYSEAPVWGTLLKLILPGLRSTLRFYSIFCFGGAVKQVSGWPSVDCKDYLSVLHICYICCGGKFCNPLQAVRVS